jgi:hypothetical protein
MHREDESQVENVSIKSRRVELQAIQKITASWGQEKPQLS